MKKTGSSPEKLGQAEFDLAVIGAGPGGYAGAIRAAQLGLKTAVAEKSKTLGGVCLNVGCIPSKALLESSGHYEFAGLEAKEHGVIFKGLKLDLGQMMRRKEAAVSDLTKGIEFLFKKNKITRFHGHARLKSPSEIEVSSEGKTEILKAKNILLCAGSQAKELPFARFDGETFVSSTEALSFPQAPEKLAVIGGGYIGLELGSVWSRLGSEVTVIEAADSICPASDKDIRKQLLGSLQRQGMKFHLGARIHKAEKARGGGGLLSFTDSEGKAQSLKFSKALVCAGRKPLTDGLGLESLGIKTSLGRPLDVNQNFQTSIPNIFAIGDMIRGPMLAHKAEEEGVAAAEFIATGFGHVNYDLIPGIIYTHPEAASAGKTEDELKSLGVPYKRGFFPFKASGRAKASGFDGGFVKILGHKDSDRILGAHILGPRAGELIAEVIVAMEFHGSCEDLARSVHAHPTLSEAVREAALAAGGRARQI